MVNYIVWLIVGAIVGGVVTLITHRRRSILLLNLCLGSFGAFLVGYLLLPLVHISTISFSWVGLLVVLGCTITLVGMVNFITREHTLANIVMEDQWSLVRRKIHSRWSKISEEEVEQVNGNHDQLIGLIEHYYGLPTVEAEDQLQGFLRAVTSRYPAPVS